MVNQSGHYCRVHTPGKGTYNLAITYLIFNLFYTQGNDVSWGPQIIAATYPMEEIFQDSLALGGVGYLWVELEAQDTPVVTHDGYG